MTDRLTELLTDEHPLRYDDGEQDYEIGQVDGRNALRAELRPEVQALRARVKELEALLYSLYAPAKTTFGATLEGGGLTT